MSCHIRLTLLLPLTCLCVDKQGSGLLDLCLVDVVSTPPLALAVSNVVQHTAFEGTIKLFKAPSIGSFDDSKKHGYCNNTVCNSANCAMEVGGCTSLVRGM